MKPLYVAVLKTSKHHFLSVKIIKVLPGECNNYTTCGSDYDLNRLSINILLKKKAWIQSYIDKNRFSKKFRMFTNTLDQIRVKECYEVMINNIDKKLQRLSKILPEEFL